MKGVAFMAIVMSMSHGEHKGMSFIDDSCVVKTKEEFDQIQRNCNKIYSNYLYEQLIKQKNAEKHGEDETA